MPRSRAIDVRRGEGAATALATALFFFVLGSYFVLRPIRETYGTDDDLETLTWLFTATFVVMLAVTPVWGWLVARYPRRRFVPVAYHLFAAQLVVLWALVDAEVAPDVLGKVFFVWTSVFNLFVVSVFWSLAADIFTPEQGRRLFGMIAAGGSAGAVVGPLLTGAIVEEVGLAGILLVAAAGVEAAVVCAIALDRRAPVRTAAAAEPIGGAALAALPSIARSGYLREICTYVLLVTVAATFFYFWQAQITRATFPDREERAAFFADLDLYTNLAVIALQLVVTASVLRWLGVGIVLASLPLIQGAGLWTLALAPTAAALVVVIVAGRAATHAFARPGRELLFTVLPREDKYKAKNVIDTLVYRFGDLGSAWLYQGIAALGLAGVGVALVATPLVVLWIAIALALGVAQRRRAAAAGGA